MPRGRPAEHARVAEVDAHLPVDEVILAVAALLALGLIGAGLIERTPVPALLVSLAIGMAVGSDGLGWVHVGFSGLHWVESVAITALALILFSGGLATSWPAMRAHGPPAAVMASAGVGITMAAVALVARPL